VVLLRYVWKSFAWRVAGGKEALVGQIGEVRQEIANGRKGMVFVAGEWWSAISRQPVAVGQQVRVVRAQGLVLEVEPTAVGGSSNPPPPKE
jgi:membrane-bound serine protease (ClpP class)